MLFMLFMVNSNPYCFLGSGCRAGYSVTAQKPKKSPHNECMGFLI